MKTARKLLLKLFVLCILCTGVFFIQGSQNTTYAADCWQRYQWCLEECDMIFNPSDPGTWSCYEDCDHTYANCS
jgi:hypothetical protein